MNNNNIGKISKNNNNIPMNNSINGSNSMVAPGMIAPSQQPQQQQTSKVSNNNNVNINNAPSNGIAQQQQQPPQPSTGPPSNTGQMIGNSNGNPTTTNVVSNNQQQSSASNLNNLSSSMPGSSVSDSVASNEDHHQHHHSQHPHQQHHHHHHHHHQHGGHSEHLSKTNLYIRGLEAETSDADLYNLCSRFGNISSTKAILDRITNLCKGYGFVDFESPQAAEVAVQELLKQGVQAQMAKVRPSYFNQQHHSQNPINSPNDQDPTNLYLANLPPYMNEQELENLLSHYGPVLSTRILRDPSNNLPRGVGFARMETRDKCEQIIKQLNGKPCKGGSEPLLVKFADGGNRKRMHHHKVHNDNRWRDPSDMMGVSSFEHQSNVSHNNLPNQMMTQMGYPRTAHGYSASVTAASYPAASSTQWLHPAQAGQPYVIPPSVMPPSSLDPSGQAAAALHYVAPMPQLTAQMQGLQLGPHSGQSVGGYLQHQQWPPQMWPQMQQQQLQQQQNQQQQFAAQQQPQPGKPQHQASGTTPSVPTGDWLSVDRS